MWTSTMDFDPKRVLMTRMLSRVWRNACFTSFAPLQVRNLPRQSLPSINWVRVRNRLAGISGGDILLVRGEGDRRIAPAALPGSHRIYPGHEVVGEVIEIGEGVQHLRVGDRVVLQYGPNCISSEVQNLCHACAEGNYNLCERGMLPSPQALGGGWSEEMLLHEDQLFRVAPELSDEQAVMLEPTAIALHAVLRHLPQHSEQILIIGAGTIGLLTLQLVRRLVSDVKISVLARHAFQVERATRMGADHIIYPKDSYNSIQRATNAQRYQGATPGNRMLLGGYDIIYDTVGTAKTLHHALRWVRARGTVVLVGTSPYLMHIDLTPIWFREISLLGAPNHGLEYWPVATPRQQSTFSIVEQLIRDGQIHPEQLITDRFALNNYREALLTAMSKSRSQAIKVIFDYSLAPASVVPNVRASARKPRSTVLPRSTAYTTSQRALAEDRAFSATPQVTPVLTEAKRDDMTVSGPALSKTPDQPVTEETSAAEEAPYIADEEEATVRVHVHNVHEDQPVAAQTASHPEAIVEAPPRNIPRTEQSTSAENEEDRSVDEIMEPSVSAPPEAGGAEDATAGLEQQPAVGERPGEEENVSVVDEQEALTFEPVVAKHEIAETSGNPTAVMPEMVDEEEPVEEEPAAASTAEEIPSHEQRQVSEGEAGEDQPQEVMEEQPLAEKGSVEDVSQEMEEVQPVPVEWPVEDHQSIPEERPVEDVSQEVIEEQPIPEERPVEDVSQEVIEEQPIPEERPVEDRSQEVSGQELPRPAEPEHESPKRSRQRSSSARTPSRSRSRKKNRR